MKKILAFNPNPIAKAFPMFADHFGIFEGNNFDILGVLCNKFITLKCGTKGYSIVNLGEYRFRKLFYYEKINQRPGNPIEFIKDKINKNYYIVLVLNGKHMSCINFPRDWFHNWIIYGYDDETMTFTVAGYLPSNETLSYEVIKLNYKDLEKAWPLDGVKTGYEGRYNDDHLCNLPENFMPEKINIAS